MNATDVAQAGKKATRKAARNEGNTAAVGGALAFIALRLFSVEDAALASALTVVIGWASGKVVRLVDRKLP